MKSWFKWANVKNSKLRHLKKRLKSYIKIINFDDTENEEYKFCRHNNLISINDIDINEKVVSNKLPFRKQEHFIGYKHDKKLHLYLYLYQKWVEIEVLIKIIVCILW